MIKILPNLKKERLYKLVIQLTTLTLITIAGPLIVALLFIKQGNL